MNRLACRVCTVLVSVRFVLVPHLLPAQADTSSLTKVAETIAAVEVLHHIRVIAHDSMLGRDTPSSGLEKTAYYVAEQFATIGLRHGNKNATSATFRDTTRNAKWFQRYPLPGDSRLNYQKSYISFNVQLADGEDWVPPSKKDEGVRWLRVPLAAAAYLDSEAWSGTASSSNLILVAGRHTTEAILRLNVAGKSVVYVPPDGLDSAMQRRIVEQLAVSSRGVLVLRHEDSTSFARRIEARRRTPRPILDEYLYVGSRGDGERRHGVVYAWAGMFKRIFSTVGVDLARLHADSTPLSHEVPRLDFALKLEAEKPAPGVLSLPNVVGVLPGSDSVLREEHIVFLAHMDHTGLSHGRADSINNGYNDNASGVAGLIELAKAFSQPGARPRRSLMFVAVSGGAKEFLGSRFFVWSRPAYIVGAINLDGIGRAPGNTVEVDGAQDLELAAPPAWVATSHPELGLTVTMGETVARPSSDHVAFVRRAIPSLYFHNGAHGGDATADLLNTIDAEQEARILRLVLYVSHGLANAPRRPAWNVEGRRQLVKLLGQ